MAGEAKTASFVIGEATVMVGPPEALWDLNPAQHSIGLVKNFTMTSEPSYNELTQGVKNQVVYSVLTNNTVRCSMEVYEFTSSNLAYGLGLNGRAYANASLPQLLDTEISVNGGTAVDTATFRFATSQASLYPAGTWIAIQDPINNDNVHIARLTMNTAVSGSSPMLHTLRFADHPLRGTRTFPVGSRIFRVNRMDVGSKADQPFLSAKIIGVLPERNAPAVLLIPKVRITKGFNLAFSSQQFGNLPFEMTPYALTQQDANYAHFAGRGVAMLLPPGSVSGPIVLPPAPPPPTSVTSDSIVFTADNTYTTADRT